MQPTPEVEKLGKLASEWDHLLQEGVVITKDEQDLALGYAMQLEKILAEMRTTGDHTVKVVRLRRDSCAGTQCQQFARADRWRRA